MATTKYKHDRPIGPSRPIGQDTKGNYVFPSRIDKGAKEPYRPPVWFGGGGSSGGVNTSKGGGSSSNNNQAQALAQQQAQQQAQELARQQAEQKARQQAEQKAQQQAQVQAQQQKTIISATGGVRQGSRGYYGKAVVPNTGGLTANQLARQIRQQAVASGQVRQKDVGRTRFEISRKKEVVPERKTEVVKETVPLNLNSLFDTSRRDFSTGTRTDWKATDKEVQLRLPGEIYQYQIGTEKVNGKNIPIFETSFIKGDFSSRLATKEERDILQTEIFSQQYLKTATSPTPSKLSQVYTSSRFDEWSSQPFIEEQWLKDVSSKGGKIGSFIGANIYGAIGTKGDVLRTGVVYGATLGVGYGVSAITTGATTGATALFGAKAGAITETTLRAGTVGAGAYLGGQHALTTATNVYQAPNIWEKGKITGRAGADVVAGTYGYRTGTKLFDITKGYFLSTGTDYTKIATDPLVESGQRRFVEISKSDFNKLTQTQRGELYKKIFEGGKGGTDIQRALGVGRGGIHATGKAGDYSELTRALHIAPRVSTNFLDLPGGSSGKFNLISWTKSLFNPRGSPRVVWFETPKGFKFIPGKETSRGFYQWSGKLTSGQKAYIPASKTEIEAVFDPRVTTGFEPVSFNPGYIVTQGVRVPFTGAYTPVSGAGTNVISSGDFTGSIPYVPESYSYTTTASGLVSPSFSSSTTSSTPSFSTISTPSSSSTTSSTPPYSIVSKTSKSYSSSSPSLSKIYSPVVSSKKVSSKVSSYKPSKSYSLSSLYSGYSSKPKSSSSYYSKRTKSKTSLFPYLKGTSKPKKPIGKFPVYVRRFGKWKSIGFGRTREQALYKGKKYSTKTLGRSFYVPGVKPSKIVPGFRTKKEKGKGLIYIQKTGKGAISTLGSKGEKQEIKYYRKVKGGKKK